MTNIEDIQKMDLHSGDPIEVELSSPRGTTNVKGYYVDVREPVPIVCWIEINGVLPPGKESELLRFMLNEQMTVRKLQYS